MENKHYPYFATYSSKLLTHFMFYSFSSSRVQVGTLPSSSTVCFLWQQHLHCLLGRYGFYCECETPGSWTWSGPLVSSLLRGFLAGLAETWLPLQSAAPLCIVGLPNNTGSHVNYRGSNPHGLRTNSVLIGTKNRDIKERQLICFGSSFYFGRTLSGWMRKDPHRYFSNMMELDGKIHLKKRFHEGTLLTCYWTPWCQTGPNSLPPRLQCPSQLCSLAPELAAGSVR